MIPNLRFMSVWQRSPLYISYRMAMSFITTICWCRCCACNENLFLYIFSNINLSIHTVIEDHLTERVCIGVWMTFSFSIRRRVPSSKLTIRRDYLRAELWLKVKWRRSKSYICIGITSCIASGCLINKAVFEPKCCKCFNWTWPRDNEWCPALRRIILPLDSGMLRACRILQENSGNYYIQS